MLCSQITYTSTRRSDAITTIMNTAKKDTPAVVTAADRIIAVITAVAIKGEYVEKTISRKRYII